MTQTLKFAVDIDQSKMSSAVSTLQNSLNTQMQQGALQLSGMYSGMGQTISNMQMQLGQAGGHAMQSLAYSMAPTALSRQNGVQPFISQREQIEGFYKDSMDTVKETAKMAAVTFANKIAPKTQSPGSYFGTKGAEFAYELAKYPISYGAGKLALGALGFAVGGPAGGIVGQMAAGIVGSVITAPISKFMDKYTKPYIGDFFGYKDPNSPEAKALAAKTSAEVQMGASMLRLSGYRVGPTSTQQDQAFGMAKTWGSSLRAIGGRMGLTDSDMMELATYGVMVNDSGIRSYRRGLRSSLTQKGGFNMDPSALTKQEAEFRRLQSQVVLDGGGDPKQAAVTRMEAQRYYNFKFQQSMMPNWWDMMGNQIGTSIQVSEKFGRQLMGAVRPIATSRDQYMNPEERKWLGGTRGIAVSYASLVTQSMQPGGIVNMGMAAMARGINPSNMMGNIGQIGAAYSDPAAIIKFNARQQEVARSIGGGGAEAIYASNMIQQAKWIKDHISPRSDMRDILTNLFMNQGMTPTAARAQAGMLLRQGNPQLFESQGTSVVDKDAWRNAAIAVLKEQGIDIPEGPAGEKLIDSFLGNIGGKMSKASAEYAKLAAGGPGAVNNAKVVARKLQNKMPLSAAEEKFRKKHPFVIESLSNVKGIPIGADHVTVMEMWKQNIIRRSSGPGFQKGKLFSYIQVNSAAEREGFVKVALRMQELRKTDIKSYNRIMDKSSSEFLSDEEIRLKNVLSRVNVPEHENLSVHDLISTVRKEDLAAARNMKTLNAGKQNAKRDDNDLIRAISNLNKALDAYVRAGKGRLD